MKIVQYFVIILIFLCSSVHAIVEGSCELPERYIVLKSMKDNTFTIQFCKNHVFYEGTVEDSVESCSCSKGKKQKRCFGQNKKWYQQEQVMGTIGNKFKNYSLVQYCSGAGTPCCQNCNDNAGCTVTTFTYTGHVMLSDFFGYNLGDMIFY